MWEIFLDQFTLSIHAFLELFELLVIFFEAHKEDFGLRDIRRDDFKTLLSLCLTSDTIQVLNHTYKQKHGVQMGNSASCPVAIIFMDYIEQQILNFFGSKIKFFKRYCDDIFLIYYGVDETEILQFCNDVNPNINFTLEVPSNGALAFLDVEISMKDDGFFSHTLFSKDDM